MSRLTSQDYDNVLDLIEAVYATPNVPGVVKNQYGYQCTDIILSMRLIYPGNTITDAQICNLLARGSRSGVFLTVCSGSTDPAVSTCDDGIALYSVNRNMVRVNPTNQIYVTAFNGVPSQPTVPIFNPYIDMTPAISGAAFITSGTNGGSNTC